MRTHNVVITIFLLIIVIVAAWLVANYFNQNEVITNCVNLGGTFNTTTQTCSVTRVSTTTTSTSTNVSSDDNATSAPKTVYNPPAAYNHVQFSTPGENASISSPVTVTGQAKGWYFEASFPVSLTDAAGRVIAQGQATAQGDWMTSNWVPFTATLSFPPQQSGFRGYIILRKDNPSGFPEFDESVQIPIIFK